jgi:hypothetical protein
MQATSLRRIEIEIVRLRLLYLTTRYSYDKTTENIIKSIKAGELDPQSFVLFDDHDLEPHEVLRGAHNLLHKLKTQFPKFLRETIFVRLISALEVFLIDAVRDIFLARRDLFQSGNKIEFTFGEVLSATSITEVWTKVINRELRKLHSQGFKEVVKFYNNRLDIDLSTFPSSISIIQELHDRRHLLVHRLGKADDQYRHRYDSRLKSLPVSEEYLLNSMHQILEFARFVAGAAQTRANQKIDTSESKANDAEASVVIEFLSEEAKAVTVKGFHFAMDDKIGSLDDILTSYRWEEGRLTMAFAGDSASVRAYLRILKRLARKDQLIIHERQIFRLEPIPRRQCNLSREALEAMAKQLPHRPWSTDIHREMANRFKISNTHARDAIRRILEDEELSRLVGSSF